jgi:hypothetical protein
MIKYLQCDFLQGTNMEGRGFQPPAFQDYGYQYQQYPQYSQYSQYPNYASYPPKKEMNTMALISMIASIAGVLIPVGAIVGLILGFIAISQIKNEPHRYEGKGFALAGIIVGISVLGVYLLFFLFYFFFIFMFLASF